MTFTGFHNISHMTMSFRVECSPGFCGPDCTTTLQNNPRVVTCQSDGTLTFNDNIDPITKCTSCLPNRDHSTNCTQCVPGWDITLDCTSCLPNRDPVTNCSLCLQPDRFTDTDCSVCALPGGDPATLCQTCLDNFNPTCTECVANYDLNTKCSSCLPGYDSISDCAVCLSGRNISTRCTTCLSGFTGSNCEPGECYTILYNRVYLFSTTESSLSVGLVGGIAGGVGGALLLIILVMAVLLILLTVHIRKSGSQDISTGEALDTCNS